MGYGTQTMIEVFRLYADITDKLGAIALVVDAYKDVVGFYKQFEFKPLLNIDKDTIAMFLMTETMRSLL